jgi:hypothetical protein
MKDQQHNCSLIFFPENQKTKEGFLLGINLTEFIVVVLEIVDLTSSNMTIADLKTYVDLPAFKTTVKHLINVRSMVIRARSRSWAQSATQRTQTRGLSRSKSCLNSTYG